MSELARIGVAIDSDLLDQFDQLINIHFLYADSNPTHVLRAAHRTLKPGGHAVFVNLTRRVPVRTTFRALKQARGLRSALAALLWVVPNSLFETFRRDTGPHYWNEAEFRARLEEAGFAVTDLRRTFFDGASLIATVRKPEPAAPAQATG